MRYFRRYVARLRRGGAIFWSLYGKYKRSLILLMLLGVLGGLLESFGVTMLIPLLSHILQEPLPETGVLATYFDALFRFLGIPTQLRYLLPFVALIFVVRAIVLFWAEYYRARITTEYERVKRRDLYRALLMSSWPQLAREKLGVAENTIKVDVSKTTKLLADATWMQLQLTTGLVYVIVAVTIAPGITLATAIAGVTFLIASQPLFSRVRKLAARLVSLNRTMAHDINESILGLKAFKAMGQESVVAERIGRIFDDFKNLRIRQSIIMAILSVTSQPVSVIFVLVIFSFAFLQPEFNLATFAVVVFLIQRIFIYVDRTQRALSTIGDAIPFASSVVRFEEGHKAVREKTDGKETLIYDSAISFNDVSFSYRKDESVLQDISFTLSKGDMLAIVGPSGVGKTTIADLLLRLLTPTSGTITVDDRPIQDIALSEWRRKVGYVSQDLFLLNDTVYNNVAFYDERIGRSDVEQALKDAALWKMVESLPQGIDTTVGDRGTTLSAGQRQRIAIARALARKPTILVLDEVTSALDAESEQAVLQTLEKLHGRVTLVVIAHRLSTVAKANVIVALKDGRTVEVGTPDELLHDKESYFYRLTHIQRES